MTAATLTRTRAVLEQGIAERLHLGGQLCVWHRGQPIADLAFGENEPGQPLTSAHLMPWFSAGKPITALAIAQLWEKAALDLDDPVVRFMPEFGQHGKDRITVRHLLTHTAGIRAAGGFKHPQQPWDAIIASICGMRREPNWTPGQKAGYHGLTSWFILGEIVRRIDGRTIEQYLREEILDPLGMFDTRLSLQPTEYERLQPRLGVMYDMTASAPVATAHHEPEHTARPSPGSSLRGPANEMARFLELMRQKGELDGVRLISPQTAEAMIARHRVGMFDHTFKFTIDWGLGFILNSDRYPAGPAPYGPGPQASWRTFGHGGQQSSIAFADPDAQLSVALVFNGMPGHQRHDQRVRAVTAALYDDLGITI